MESRSSPSALRSVEIWTARLFSSTTVSGQTRLRISSLVTSAPRASTRTMSTSKARLPSSTATPSARSSRRCGSNRNRPNSTAPRASLVSLMASAFRTFSKFSYSMKAVKLRFAQRFAGNIRRPCGRSGEGAPRSAATPGQQNVASPSAAFRGFQEISLAPTRTLIPSSLIPSPRKPGRGRDRNVDE